MLSKKDRLVSHKDFKAIFNAKNRENSRFAHIAWEQNDSKKNAKVGFVAAIKKFPKAVDRNKAKRLAREAIRTVLKGKQLKEGLKLVFYMKPNILENKKKEEIKKDFLSALMRLKLIKNKNGTI